MDERNAVDRAEQTSLATQLKLQRNPFSDKGYKSGHYSKTTAEHWFRLHACLDILYYKYMNKPSVDVGKPKFFSPRSAEILSLDLQKSLYKLTRK